MILKCKPVYNFQSIEFEYVINEMDFEEESKRMFEIYNLILKGLQQVAPEQPALAKPVAPKKEPKKELLTLGQKNFLTSLGIPFDDTTTKEEANELIKKATRK